MPKKLTMKKPIDIETKFNFREKSKCPIPGECNQFNVIYQAYVHGDGKVLNYFGSTENFKHK